MKIVVKLGNYMKYMSYISDFEAGLARSFGRAVVKFTQFHVHVAAISTRCSAQSLRQVEGMMYVA